MKQKVKYSLIAVLLSVLMMFTSLASSFSVLAAENQDATVNADMTGENWMGYLPNQTNLGTINLPGTHDSSTAYIMDVQILDALTILMALPVVGPIVTVAITPLLPGIITQGGYVSLKAMAKDQQLSIQDQFNNGIRLIDCRLSNYHGDTGSTDDLEFSHGGIRCQDTDGSNLTMKKVLTYAKDFVKKNPTETVVLGIRDESFFPIPAPGEVDNKVLSALLNAVFGLLEKKFGGKELYNIGKYAKEPIQKLLNEELPNDPDVIVVKDKQFPTMGEARGKVIICDKDVSASAEDVQIGSLTYDVDDYDMNGSDKWDTLKSYFDAAEDQVYSTQSSQIHIAESSCTGGNGTYMKKSLVALIRDILSGNILIPGDLIFQVLSALGLDVDSESGGDAQAKIVNPKFKAYNLQKGKYYGWIYMDFVDADLISHYYQSNIFDFDIAGKPLEYISDIAIAYDQKFENAQQNLVNEGYQTLKHNFNAEGPDKGLSDAIVNGIPNNGSFNMAVGYKTTTDPIAAITGLIWLTKPKESEKPDDKTQQLLNDYDFRLVQTAGTTIETKEIQQLEGFCNLNIGTSGKLVNLYVTKDQRFGERLIALDSVQGYNKADTDVNTGEPYPEEDIARSEKAIKKHFEKMFFEMPRNIDGYALSNNYGRNEINDVALFYNAAFNDPGRQNTYFKLYNGPHAGKWYDINQKRNDKNDDVTYDGISQPDQPANKVIDFVKERIKTGMGEINADLAIMLGFIAIAAAGIVVVMVRRKLNIKK